MMLNKKQIKEMYRIYKLLKDNKYSTPHFSKESRLPDEGQVRNNKT